MLNHKRYYDDLPVISVMKCPTCGSDDCVLPAEEVLSRVSSMYLPCNACVSEVPLDKLIPLRSMGLEFSRDTGRCKSCGKRHIDMSMAQALDILIDEGLKGGNAALKDTGTPLIVYGMELIEPPRLGACELLLVLDDVDSRSASRILAEVPEVRGVLKRYGGPKKSVGLLDTDSQPHIYQLMAGCDVRADIVSSLLGDMVFYRNQAQMHIEFHRNNSTKIKILEKMFLDGSIAGKTVVDGFASAGTLGLLAAAADARKVILNDAWLPAVKNMLVNVEVNKKALGVSLEILEPPENLHLVSDRPVLAGRASGKIDIEIWHADFRKLADIVRSCDICIIDAFPGVVTEEFTQAWRGVAKEKLVVL